MIVAMVIPEIGLLQEPIDPYNSAGNRDEKETED